MTEVVIILSEQGVYEAAYSDSEVVFHVLKRGQNKGQDDQAIDRAESYLSELYPQ